MRISNSCDIVPKGIYKVRVEDGQEETGYEDIDKEEELKTEKLEYYLNLDNWVHLLPEITNNGRITKEEVEFNEDVDEDSKEVIRKQISLLDPPSKRLKPISKDSRKVISRKLDKVLVVQGLWRQC